MSEDFDWVKARAACSIAVVFKELQMGVKADVEIANALPGREGQFKVADGGDSDHFAVVRDQPRGNTDSVEFVRSGGRITAAHSRTKAKVEATLTLNDDGECRLKVNGKEVGQWQFRRKALEDLFFDSPPSDTAGGPR